MSFEERDARDSQLTVMRFLLAALAMFAAPYLVPQNAPPVPAHRTIDANAGAQADFDEGLTALYAFAPVVARKKFEAAAAADPLAAMPLWGIALSYGPNVNGEYESADQRAAHAAIEQARRLAGAESPSNQALIAAAGARYRLTGASDAQRSAAAYYAAMRSAAAAFPADPDVLALAAESALNLHPWAWYDDAGKPAEGIADARAWLATALSLAPSHLGALHFTIHATELSPQPQDGRAAAERLSSIALPPYAEHLAHMPAHTFMRIGMYHEAGEANARALSLDPDASGYRNHDALFGVDAYMMSGERAKALAVAGAFSDAGAGERAKSRIAVRFNRCMPDDPAIGATPFARGVCAARHHDIQAAEAELRNLRSAGDDVDAIATFVLRSEIARAQGDTKSRIASLQKAVEIQDKLGYSEPPDWYYPVRESLGAALLYAGDAKGAEAVFRRDLAINPGNPRSLFGLAQALQASGDGAGAASALASYKRAWEYADVPLAIGDL